MGLRDWLHFEAITARERERIRRRQRRAPRWRKGKAPIGPRWLVSLDLALGALLMVTRVSATVWLAALFALAVLAVLVVALWHYLAAALALYIIYRLARRYLAYRRAAEEVPY